MAENPSSAESVKEAARERTKRAKSGAAEAAGQIKEKAGEAAAGVKERTAEMAGERRERMADRVGDYSSAVRDTAQSVKDDDPNIAWFTERAAERLEEMADYIRQCSFGQLRDDAERLARRHPAAALSGLFISGLLLGSTIKAGRSASRSDTSAGEFDYEAEAEMARGESMESPVSAAPESSEVQTQGGSS